MVGTIESGRALRWSVAILLMLTIAWRAPEAAASGDEAEAFIDNLAKKSIVMMDPAYGTVSEREAEFRRIVGKGFAMATIGRFVVGRHWRTMTDEQRTEYQMLFREWLLKSYSGRLRQGTGQEIKFLKTTVVSKRDTFVRTRINQVSSRPPVIADWRVRKFDGQYKIIDIVVEGVSMAAAQKSEFESVIRREGIDGLIGNLRSRLAMLNANTG